MQHTVLITAHPSNLAVYEDAMSFCQSSLDAGNKINQIFFMHEANNIVIDQAANTWSDFAKRHDIDLQTCSSTAEDYSIELADYAQGFNHDGLSCLADSIISSDQLVQFGVENSIEPGTYLQDEIARGKFKKKPIVFIFNSRPIENSVAREGVDLLLVFSAFESEVKVIFKGHGVQNLVNHRDQPRYVKRFQALSDFGVNDCYVVNNIPKETSLPLVSITEDDINELSQSSHVLFF